MIRWKDSVRFTDLHPVISLALTRADAIYSTFGQDCWITSLNDSEHMIGSLHYVGRAVDLRTHNLPDEVARLAVATQLRAALGKQFDVLYEHPGKPQAHIHIEYTGP